MRKRMIFTAAIVTVALGASFGTIFKSKNYSEQDEQIARNLEIVRRLITDGKYKKGDAELNRYCPDIEKLSPKIRDGLVVANDRARDAEGRAYMLLELCGAVKEPYQIATAKLKRICKCMYGSMIEGFESRVYRPNEPFYVSPNRQEYRCYKREFHIVCAAATPASKEDSRTIMPKFKACPIICMKWQDLV